MSEDRPTGWEGADRWFSKEAGGTGGGGAGEAPPPVPPCAVCGADLEADQTYCLECGSPTPLAPRLHRGAGRGVAILAGAAVILGLGAGALAFAVVRDDGGSSTTTPGALTGAPLVPTGVTVPLPPETGPTTGSLPPDTSFTTPTTPVVTATDTSGFGTSGFDTVTGPASVPATEPTTEPTTEVTTSSIPPTTTQSSGGLSDWPAGRTAWTAILASTRSEADARAAKRRVAGAGDPAGVLFSTDFTGLRPGYWVVFSGTYASRNTAIAQAVKLRPDFPSAYARRIEG